MTALLTMLSERREEFDTHHALAVSLEDQMFRGEEVTFGSTRLSVRHLCTMKSGLIIHLYNVIESVMTQATKLVGSALGTVPARTWSQNARREWLREYGVERVEGGADARLMKIESLSTMLLTDGPLGAQAIKKPAGTWNDDLVRKFSERLGVYLKVEPDLSKKLAKQDHLGEKSPLEFLADRRNGLAHGHLTFEEGGKDLTLARIREIADIALDFMELVATSFQTYVDQKHFIAAT